MIKTIIVGKTASGKDYLRKRLELLGFNYAVPYTTRPKRNDEVDGLDYNFIDDSRFDELTTSNWWITKSQFNGWKYGLSHVQYTMESNLFIMSPSDIEQLGKYPKKISFIIYLDIPYEIRKERLLLRDMPGDTADRRLESDEIDFLNFKTYDLRITNPNF